MRMFSLNEAIYKLAMANNVRWHRQRTQDGHVLRRACEVVG